MSKTINWLFVVITSNRHTVTVITAMFIGVISAMAIIVFRSMTEIIRDGVFIHGQRLLHIGTDLSSRALLPVLPIIGAIMLIPLSMRFPGEVCGYGLPGFLENVNLKGGVIKLRTVFLKMIATSITIGTGGSAGVEGPSAIIGGGIGSLVGQWLGLSKRRLRLLIASGAAGAIAAIFNAPIAGVMFATEIIMLGNYEMESFGAVVISAGMAPAVSQAYYGAYPTFIVTSHDMIGVREIPFYLLFGLLLGVISVIYIKVFYGIKDFLAAINLPQHVKAIAGAFCIGLIGIFLPQVMGDGYASITEALNGHYSLTLFVVLIFFKILATSITLGSGGAGGVFAPSLFIGAMTGDAFESAVHRLFPHMTSNPGAYATVGIGAFLAAVTHAPLTGIFLLIEMTGDYKVIIPVMFASITGLFVSKALLKDSIDTFELSRRGVDLFIGKEMSILQAIKVKDIMRKDFTTVNEHEPINTVSDMIINGDGLCFPVIRDSGEIAGIISMQDVKAVMLEEYIKTVVTAGQLATEDVVLLNNLDNMKTALERFSINDQDEIPVVDFLNHKKIVGMLNRSDMIAAYIRAVMQ